MLPWRDPLAWEARDGHLLAFDCPFAVWNLAGNDKFAGGDGNGIDPASRKAANQIRGLAHLDADFVTLVEVFPESHIALLAEKLRLKGLDYAVTFQPQPQSHLGIGFLHKPGIEVTNPRFIPGSEGVYAGAGRPLRWT